MRMNLLKQSPKQQFLIAASILFISNCLYAIWSFALTDPNLVYSSWPPFWKFQQMMWQLSKQHVTVMYDFLVMILFGAAIWMRRMATSLHLGFKRWLLLFIILVSPLLISNNALSHDVFNYIFNAKMVVKYQTNPHLDVALSFSGDPWLRFMHNVHTPAPYFYGWTAMSLIPYILGLEKFLVTWVLFRLWSTLGLFLCFVFVILLMKKRREIDLSAFVFILFNPLLIIEIISNSHNDAWMLSPLLGSFFLVTKEHNADRISPVAMLSSLVLLLVSISTKYVTVLLAPIWLYLVLQSQLQPVVSLLRKQFFRFLDFNIFDVCAVLMFLPLVSARSQYFHPWYLSWSLFFFPLMSNRWLRRVLAILSISSLFRYVPWIWNGGFEFSEQIIMYQRLITWIPLGLLITYFILKKRTHRTLV
jgi:hypothetical protein